MTKPVYLSIYSSVYPCIKIIVSQVGEIKITSQLVILSNQMGFPHTLRTDPAFLFNYSYDAVFCVHRLISPQAALIKGQSMLG